MSWQIDVSVWTDKPDSIQVFSDDGREQDYVPERTGRLDKNGNCSVCGAYIETITHAIYEMGDMFACSPHYCPCCGAKVVIE